MLYLTGITISVFLSLLLIGKGNKTQADKILTLWVSLLSLNLVFYYFSFSSIIHSYPFLFGLHFPMPLLHGPFLYLYAGALTKNLAVAKRSNLLHFIPAIIFYLAYIPFFQLPIEQKISIIKSGWAGFQLLNSACIVAIIISGIIYVTLTSILLHKHRRTILNQFSFTEKITLRWLQYLTYGVGLIWVFIIFSHDEIIFAIAVLFIFFLGYFGIKQVGIFTQGNAVTVGALASPPTELPESKTGNENSEPVSDTKGNNTGVHDPQGPSPGNNNDENNITDKAGGDTRNKKYLKSGLTSDSANQLHLKLSGVMNTEKLFKENDLTLAQLANRLNTHPNYLSQVINDKENKSFFDYINSLRTKEFIEIVSNADNQKYTLMGLAFECGFNSKSSFNKYFKKITGKSPSEYLDLLRAEKA